MASAPALGQGQTRDGRVLPRFRWWHAFYSSVFILDPSGDRTVPFAVRVDYTDLSETVELYRDGAQAQVSTAPAAFAVPGGTIEVAMTTFGLKRAHVVADDGTERMLRPVPGSAEYARARFGRRYPRLSRMVGWAAIVILVVGLAVAVPAALEQVTRIEWVADRVGTWTLPTGVTEALTIAGVVAAVERVLTLRNHWLLDADTWWL